MARLFTEPLPGETPQHVPEYDVPGCAKHHPTTVPEYDVILCGAGESIFAEMLLQQVSEGRILHFKNEVELTRWLFKRPRGLTWAKLLVTGFREAKPCMDAIMALRSGDVSKLRKDPKRVELSEAEPGVEISAAFAEMAIVVASGEQRRRAWQWLSKGELDPDVRACIVVGSEQLRHNHNFSNHHVPAAPPGLNMRRHSFSHVHVPAAPPGLTTRRESYDNAEYFGVSLLECPRIKAEE